MAKGHDIDMVWAMISCFEPMEKMVEMSGISEEEIRRIAREEAFDLSYL